ncbi:fibrillarin-like rRNA/tRNA 2'-O-methyltransferase [archaeon]|nr:MAG: fibrillarin-like rRNA/tRNA 2'-O-methyltransferase [archaeon]
MKAKPSKFQGVFNVDGKFATINLVPGKKVYGEELFKQDGVEYRVWDYTRSKPAAALKKGLNVFPLEKGMKILYLGVASGTTASHFSDIIGKDGIIYGVDIAERVLRDLVSVAEARGNILPMLADSRKPEEYENQIFEQVDVVFEDVASDDQIPILIRNSEKFLKSHGIAMIAIKSQSIDVTRDPQEIYKEALVKLEEHFDIIDKVELDPYEKHHLFVVMKFRR